MSGILGVFAVWLLLLILLSTGYHYLKAWVLGRFRARRGTFGTAHFMTAVELKATGFLNEQSGIVLGRVKGQTLRDSGEGHCLLIGASRGGGIRAIAGKGTTTVVPTCYEWAYDLVCVDPKGQNYERTGQWREDHGSQVYSFDPMGDSSDTSINLLSSIRLGTPYALSDSDVISVGFIPLPPLEKPGPRHYASQGQRILSTVLLYIRECDQTPSLGACYRFMTSPEPHKKRLGRMLASTHAGVLSHAQELLRMKDDQLGPLWSSATDGLSLWRDPRLDTRTSRHDVDLGAFQTGDQPISLFLRSPEPQLERLAPLMRTIVQVVINRCMERSIDRSRRKLLFLLDEFSSMGPCLPIVNSLPRMSEYGLRCCLVCQDLSDITRLYGPHNNVVQNCGTRIFYVTNDVHTADYVCRLLSIETIEAEAESHSTGSSGLRSNASDGLALREAARPLLTIGEIMTFSEHHSLVFLSAQHPLIAEKIRWNDPAYWHEKGVTG